VNRQRRPELRAPVRRDGLSAGFDDFLQEPLEILLGRIGCGQGVDGVLDRDGSQRLEALNLVVHQGSSLVERLGAEIAAEGASGLQPVFETDIRRLLANQLAVVPRFRVSANNSFIHGIVTFAKYRRFLSQFGSATEALMH